jgi:hypothetical protein
LKFLIACALIAAMSETAMAQMKPDPEKCRKLHLTDFTFTQDTNGNISLSALVHNDDPYNVTSASFSFDLLVGEDFKVGEASTMMGRLMHGNKERVRLNFGPINQEMKGYITAGALRFYRVSSSCSFSQ